MKGASLIAPLGVRIPDDLKEKIQEQAKGNGRSMNAEIVSIIEKSFSTDTEERHDAAHRILTHLQQIIDLKDQIIASQESSISSQRETINSLERTISALEGHIEILQGQLEQPRSADEKPT